MSTYQCEILTIERELFSGEVEYASLPAQTGGMGVYANHEPMITLLKPGIVKLNLPNGGEEVHILINDGYAGIGKRGLQILCMRAERVDNIDSLDKQQIGVKLDECKERLAELAEDDPKAEFLRDEIEWCQGLLDFRK